MSRSGMLLGNLFDSVKQLPTIVVWIWAVNQTIAIPSYLVVALKDAEGKNKLEEFNGKLLYQ